MHTAISLLNVAPDNKKELVYQTYLHIIRPYPSY